MFFVISFNLVKLLLQGNSSESQRVHVCVYVFMCACICLLWEVLTTPLPNPTLSSGQPAHAPLHPR